MQGFSSRTAYPRLLVLAAVLSLSSTAGTALAANGPTALTPGAWSVELGVTIDGSSDPSSAVALKRNMGERSALRIGLGLGFFDTDLEGEFEDTSPVSTEDVAQQSTTNNWALFLHYVRYGMLSDRVATQLAFGPTIQVARSGSRQSFDVGAPGFQESEFSSEQKLYGLELLLGVEWFFVPRFSLGGQAGVRGLTGDADQIQVFRSGDGPTYQFERYEVSGDVSRLETITSRIVLTGYF